MQPIQKYSYLGSVSVRLGLLEVCVSARSVMLTRACMEELVLAKLRNNNYKYCLTIKQRIISLW